MVSKNCFTVAGFEDLNLVKQACIIDGRSIGGFMKHYSAIAAKNILSKNKMVKNES